MKGLISWFTIIFLLLLPVEASAGPVLLAPTSGQIFYEKPPVFYWVPDSGSLLLYEFEIADSPYLDSNGMYFRSPLFKKELLYDKKQLSLAEQSYSLPYYSTYYWHIVGTYLLWFEPYSSKSSSPTWSFQLKQTPPPAPVKAQSVISLKAIPQKIRKGKTAILKGRLYGASNQASVANATVRIQRPMFGDWVTTSTLKTRSDGSFSVKARPSKATAYRALFVENNNYLSSNSNSVKIIVIQSKKKPKKKR